MILMRFFPLLRKKGQIGEKLVGFFPLFKISGVECKNRYRMRYGEEYLQERSTTQLFRMSGRLWYTEKRSDCSNKRLSAAN